MKTEIYKEEIKCPKCDSEKWRFNAFHNLVPIEDQFTYTCAECQEQFNMPEIDIISDSEPLYGFQCQKCYLRSGEVSSDPNDAPRCCGGDKMVVYEIPLIPLKNIGSIQCESETE